MCCPHVPQQTNTALQALGPLFTAQGTHGCSASASCPPQTRRPAPEQPGFLVPALRQSLETLKTISVFAILYLSLFTARVLAAFPGNGTLCCSAASKGQPSFPQPVCSGGLQLICLTHVILKHCSQVLCRGLLAGGCISFHITLSFPAESSGFVWSFLWAPGATPLVLLGCSGDSAG